MVHDRTARSSATPCGRPARTDQTTCAPGWCDKVEAVGGRGHLDERGHPQVGIARDGQVLEDPRDGGQRRLVPDEEHVAGLGGQCEGPTARVAAEPGVRPHQHDRVTERGLGDPVPRRAGVGVEDHVDVHRRTGDGMHHPPGRVVNSSSMAG